MPGKTPTSEAIRDQTEELRELLEELTRVLEHLADHICCVCHRYYGADEEGLRMMREDEPE